MKRRVASVVLLACVVGAAAFEVFRRTRYWVYPLFEIGESGPTVYLYQLIELGLMLQVLAVSVASAWRAADGDRKSLVTFVLSAAVVYAFLFLMGDTDFEVAIGLVQKCVVATCRTAHF